MKKTLKRYPIIFLSLFLFIDSANAQTEAAKLPAVFNDMVGDAQQIETYSGVLDSLIIEEHYQDIIEYGERLAMIRDPEIAKIPVPYLIAAYYFTGNTDRSKQLLDNWISNLDYKGFVSLLTNNNIAFIKYFNEPGNGEPLIKAAIKDYRSTEKASDKQAGEQIIRFFINDQSCRKVKHAFRKEDQVAQSQIQERSRRQDSIQNLNIYAFYKDQSKYLSEEEVGETVSSYQRIVLSHYDNIKLRQTFFKDLLEKAVKGGRLEKVCYVHFLLRTESFTDPEFFKNLDKKMEEVRTTYDLPDYIWNPF